MLAPWASMATLMSRNHDSDSVPVAETSVLSWERSVKSLLVEVKFQRLAAAYVRTGGSSRWDDTLRKGTVICGGRILVC